MNYKFLFTTSLVISCMMAFPTLHSSNYHSSSSELIMKTMSQPVDSVYDFGKIKAGKPVKTTFIWRNNSTKASIINNVYTSCGCTTPEWSKKPVVPRKNYKITVGYNAANTGYFDKTITVLFSDGSEKNLFIKGEVI